MYALENSRKYVDAIDWSILKLLAKRMRVVVKIGKIKKKKGLACLDQERWEAVLRDRIQKGKKLDLDQKYIQDIYKIIHKYALRKEEDI